MKAAIANDHAAVQMKEAIAELLEQRGIEVLNFGTDASASCDYPDYARKAAQAVADHEADFGIVICGTGIGISIAANKVRGIRCGLCKDVTDARLTREHNNANMLALGARTTGLETARDIVNTFIDTPFSEGPNHIRRIQKIAAMEDEIMK